MNSQSVPCPKPIVTGEPGVVFVVEDDPSVRAAVSRLLKSVGLRVEAFASGEQFLEHSLPDVPTCIILDVCMPGRNGLEVQRILSERSTSPPVIFITSHVDIPLTVQAMKAGAVDFLPKPFHNQALLAAVRSALDRHARARQEAIARSAIHQRIESLSPRQREVLAFVISGLPNKQIGRRMGVGEKTIKVHRAHVMEKMQAGSLAELVRMADKVGVAMPDRETLP